MEKRYKFYEPGQSLLFPPNVKDWLPEDHLAYFVSDVVDQLDLSQIEAVYEKDTRGQPPYHPRMMTKLLMYGYCTGTFSSRRIQQALTDEVPFRVLAAGNKPDFRTISDFRKIHHQALQALFEQVLEMALKAGAMKLGRVALDGSKVKANASKHKAMSYGRMKEKETQLRKEVRALLKEADRIDSREDKLYGGDRRGDEFPEELRRRETRLAKIREAKRALEDKAREKAKAEGKDPDTARPAEKDQYNFTDSESRIMRDSDRFEQAYNVQAAVEDTFQLIVGQTVTQEANDKKQLEPMVEKIKAQSGQKPEQLLADSGYCSEPNLEYLSDQGIDTYIATEKVKHGANADKAKPGPLPRGATLVDRMKRKLQTKGGLAIYAARKGIVEPVFGYIKHGRGFRQFLLRGLQKVKAEWALVCLTHNVLKMYRICYR
jgi:transposase